MNPTLKADQMIRVSGERGAQTVTDTWVVTESCGRGRYLVYRLRDARRAVLDGATLRWSRGPKTTTLRRHCTVEVV